MTDSEFINGIANGTLGYGDIIAFAKEYPSIQELLSSLFAKVVQLDTENVVLCETDKGTLVNTDISIEQETKRERVMKAMDYIESYFKIYLFDDVPEGTETKLPEELNTDEAKKYFKKAIELGLMDDNYKWLGGLQMCACFAREMNLKLGLGEIGRISWKPFETLFELPKGKLRLQMNDIHKIGKDPSKASLIDKIFN